MSRESLSSNDELAAQLVELEREKKHAEVFNLFRYAPHLITGDGFSSLHIAVANELTGLIDALLKAGADITAVDKQGRTPIQLARGWSVIERFARLRALDDEQKITDAAAYSRILIAAINRGAVGPAEALIKANTNLARVVEEITQDTVLHLAARLGQVEIVKALLAEGANLSVCNALKRTPLQVAVDAQRWEVVQAIVDQEKRDLSQAESDTTGYDYALVSAVSSLGSGSTRPLMQTVSYSLIKILPPCAKAAIANALKSAAKMTDLSLFETLLSKGSELFGDNIDWYIHTMKEAAFLGKWAVVQLCAQHSALARYTNLEGVRRIYGEILCLAVNAVIDNSGNEYGYGYEERRHTRALALKAAFALTNTHADLTYFQSPGKDTALHLAVKGGLEELALHLLRKGASLTALNAEGKAPIMLSFDRHQEHIVCALARVRELDAEERADDKAQYGKALLALIANKKSLSFSYQISLSYEIIEAALALIKAKAPLECRDLSSGVRPLFFAAACGLVDVVEALLLAGANSNAESEQERAIISRLVTTSGIFKLIHGLKPLNIAAHFGDMAAIARLLPSADITHKDHKGRPPIIAAAEAAHWQAVEALCSVNAALATKEDLDPAGHGLALVLAAKANQLATVLALLRAQARLDHTIMDNHYKKSALHFAIDHDNVEMLAALLDAGANEQAVDAAGCILVEYAEAKKKPRCVAEIEDVTKTDSRDAAKLAANPLALVIDRRLRNQAIQDARAKALNLFKRNFSKLKPAQKIAILRNWISEHSPNVAKDFIAEQKKIIAKHLINSYRDKSVRPRDIEKALVQELSEEDLSKWIDAEDLYLLDLEQYKKTARELFLRMSAVELLPQQYKLVIIRLHELMQLYMTQLKSLSELAAIDRLYLAVLQIEELVENFKLNFNDPTSRLPDLTIDGDLDFLEQLKTIPDRIMQFRAIYDNAMAKLSSRKALRANAVKDKSFAAINSKTNSLAESRQALLGGLQQRTKTYSTIEAFDAIDSAISAMTQLDNIFSELQFYYEGKKIISNQESLIISSCLNAIESGYALLSSEMPGFKIIVKDMLQSCLEMALSLESERARSRMPSLFKAASLSDLIQTVSHMVSLFEVHIEDEANTAEFTKTDIPVKKVASSTLAENAVYEKAVMLQHSTPVATAAGAGAHDPDTEAAQAVKETSPVPSPSAPPADLTDDEEDPSNTTHLAEKATDAAGHDGDQPSTSPIEEEAEQKRVISKA